jgi:hypothetical protein
VKLPFTGLLGIAPVDGVCDHTDAATTKIAAARAAERSSLDINSTS